MLVGSASDEALAFEGGEAINCGLVGDNLAAGLDFPDAGSVPALCHIALNELEHRLLFIRKLEQSRGLTTNRKITINRLEKINILTELCQTNFWLVRRVFRESRIC